jgi:hypothetical protein
MGAALPLVRSLYTWSIRSEMWLYALLNNSVLRISELQDLCHQEDVMGEPIPSLPYIIKRIPCASRIFTSLLCLLFCLSELNLDVIKPRQQLSAIARVKVM